MSGTVRLTRGQRCALLQREVKWAEEKAAAYRAAFSRIGVTHADVKDFADMARLPFWDAVAEEGAHAPFFMLTLPLSGLMRMSMLRDAAEGGGHMHCYTQGDVARQVQVTTDMLAACGIHRASTVLLVGNAADSRILDLQYALDGLGATVLSCASAADALCLMDVAVPDTLIAWEHDLPVLEGTLQKMALYRLISIGTQVGARESTRQMAARLGACHMHLFTRAPMGALIGYHSGNGAGIHIEERLFLAEIVDAAGNSSTADGGCGELVLSTIAAEAMPVLRYRMGLRVRLMRGQDCSGNEKIWVAEA